MEKFLLSRRRSRDFYESFYIVAGMYILLISRLNLENFEIVADSHIPLIEKMEKNLFYAKIENPTPITQWDLEKSGKNEKFIDAMGRIKNIFSSYGLSKDVEGTLFYI